MEGVVDTTTLSFESIFTRRRIVISYWLVILFAIPIWWKTTSIDRLSLPESQVYSIVERKWPIIPPSVATTSHRVVKYAPKYRLAFTLLNENAGSGNGAMSWEVEDAMERYLRPTLDRFGILHNFTVESQVQYHAPLAFKPVTAEEGGGTIHGLTQEDLTVFVNSAEWTLSSSVSNDPVLHFVLFVPSTNNKPLYILDGENRPLNSNAFILPQWGGILLLNEPTSHLSSVILQPFFSVFCQQLLALLGATDDEGGVSFSDEQLDRLVRRRTYENVKDTQETLQSIVALVRQIENMPVGQDVKGDVQNSLSELDQAFAFSASSSTDALIHSSEALKLASRAFFNPGMLALLYFPAEHKYAVYTPLFASIAAPLVAAVVREFLAWKRSRSRPAAAPATARPHVE
ncbi:GPI transamidase component [Steccherinum ochraceum]|uniref:GPI transamidase component n=1 Tax=Steccherinum ochraceum TaxID=92696 RepID=A0A4V2MXM4_9APHY|nr:GPI transamidase component [Steccherinum ochraceum]